MKILTIEEYNQNLLSLNLINKDLPDKKKIRILYSLSNRIERNYKVYKIKKHTQGYRKIYAPNPFLKRIRQNILQDIFTNRFLLMPKYTIKEFP